MGNKLRLGDHLVAEKYITQKQLADTLAMQKITGKKIGELLLEQGIISQQQLAKVLQTHLNINGVYLSTSSIDKKIANIIPENICKRYIVFPYKVEGEVLYLAMADPLDRGAIQEIKRITRMDIIPLVSTSNEIRLMIDVANSNVHLSEAIEEYNKESNINKNIIKKEDELLSSDANSAPIIRLVYNVLESAVVNGASDIHIEGKSDYMRVRFRVDGVLKEFIRTDIRPYKAVISRIKIMANMNISEKRVPQDGRIYQKIEGRDIDFRVSTMPTGQYEKIVMRVLDKSNFMVSEERLGLNEFNIEKYNNLLKKPYGLIIVTGPTGSGKTTTLYAMLNKLNDVEKNILTIEDPIEYDLDGINQSQINTKAGLDFPNALRSFLRQDPDIIMVGEVRDFETAEIAVRASLTGHLVLSTLHANSACGTIVRLMDMKIDSFLISSSVIGVVAQRLARTICKECRKPYLASNKEKELLNIDENEEVYLYKASGCDFCNETGYKGRLAIYEILEIDKLIKDAINDGKKEDEIYKIAVSSGMKTMREDAIEKVLNGFITIEEMMRITLSSE